LQDQFERLSALCWCCDFQQWTRQRTTSIVSFIWGIADDVLRDLFRRGKYPDVILPMCVLRRMDAVLEPTKQAVLDTKQMLDDAHITEQRAALAPPPARPSTTPRASRCAT
jgi:type I restriction-modification system DNA methylase subunit